MEKRSSDQSVDGSKVCAEEVLIDALERVESARLCIEKTKGYGEDSEAYRLLEEMVKEQIYFERAERENTDYSIKLSV